jgi:glucose-6-phosphate dehydrogenase assembly protein OpcA
LTEATIQPEKLLAELSELWASLAREKKSATGLVRARSMTLLVTCEDDADAAHAREIVGQVMRRHPARAILIRMQRGKTAASHVFAECSKGPGGNEQICSEGIEVVADAAELSDVARQIGPLAAPDLPVMLWCRGAQVFSSTRLDPLFALAHRIIVDSCLAPDAEAALKRVKKIRGRGGRAGDLAWTRITGWREALAGRFAAKPEEVSQIRAASIRYSGAGVDACALYLKRWIEGAAPQTKIEMERIEGTSGIREVSISAAGREITISAAEARSTGMGETELISEELTITGRDPVFEKLLERE